MSPHYCIQLHAVKTCEVVTEVMMAHSSRQYSAALTTSEPFYRLTEGENLPRPWTMLLPAWNDWTWCDEAEAMCQHLSPGDPWQGEILWPDPHRVTDQSEASIGWCWPIRRLAWSSPGRGHPLAWSPIISPGPRTLIECQDPDKTSKMWPGQDKSPPSISSLKLNFDPRGLKHWELVRSGITFYLLG